MREHVTVTPAHFLHGSEFMYGVIHLRGNSWRWTKSCPEAGATFSTSKPNYEAQSLFGFKMRPHKVAHILTRLQFFMTCLQITAIEALLSSDQTHFKGVQYEGFLIELRHPVGLSYLVSALHPGCVWTSTLTPNRTLCRGYSILYVSECLEDKKLVDSKISHKAPWKVVITNGH